jgi:hypothetical protein
MQWIFLVRDHGWWFRRVCLCDISHVIPVVTDSEKTSRREYAVFTKSFLPVRAGSCCVYDVAAHKIIVRITILKHKSEHMDTREINQKHSARHKMYVIRRNGHG